MGASLKSNYPQFRKMSHAPRFSTSSTFLGHPIDLPALSSVLRSYLSNQSLHYRRHHHGNAHRGYWVSSDRFLLRSKIPAEIKWLLISLDTSERNESNRVRRSRA